MCLVKTIEEVFSKAPKYRILTMKHAEALKVVDKHPNETYDEKNKKRKRDNNDDYTLKAHLLILEKAC